MLEAEKLVRNFGDTTALAGISFSLNPGICVVAGPNGAGKTTLLRAVSAVDPADSGRVMLDGMDVYSGNPRIRRHISYLSDSVPLYRDLTVEDHLQYRGRLKGLPARRLRARIRHVTDLLDLRPVFTRRTSALSAGQRKRVGIADAMLTDSRVLAIDEPFDGLDADHRALLAKALRGVARHTLVMLATHVFDALDSAQGTCMVLSHGEIASMFAFGGDCADKRPLAERIASALAAGSPEPKDLAK